MGVAQFHRSGGERSTGDPQLLDDLAFWEGLRHDAEARAHAKGPDISEDDDDIYEIFGCMRNEDEIREAFLTDREREALAARYAALKADGEPIESARREVYGGFYRMRANARLKRLGREDPSNDFLIGSYQELVRDHRAFRSEARSAIQSALVFYRRLPRAGRGCRSRSKRSGVTTRRRGSRRTSSGRRSSSDPGGSDPPGLGPLRLSRLNTRPVFA